MVLDVSEELLNRFPTISLDTFTVRPNHVHSIVVLHRPEGVPLVGTKGDGDRANQESWLYVGLNQ